MARSAACNDPSPRKVFIPVDSRKALPLVNQPVPMSTEEADLVQKCSTRQFLRKYKADVHSVFPSSVKMTLNENL